MRPAAETSDQLRVVFLLDHLVDTGGAERFVIGLASQLRRYDVALTVCSTRSFEPEVVGTLAQAGVDHLHLGRRTKFDLYRFGDLARLLRQRRINVLHTHMFGSNLWGSLVGRACAVPVIIAHEQTWSYEGEPLRKWLDGRVIGRLCTRFVAVSTADARRMVSLEHVPESKVVMIHNAYVRRPGPSSTDTDLRGELGLAEGTPIVTVVSELRRQKALWVLLAAFPAVMASVPDAHLVIAGHGETREELEQQALQLGVADHVHFLGRRFDVDGILRSADVAAMSSDYEGTPLVAYECFANRIPLVATAVGGLPDIIEDGRNGRLVPPRDPPALAAALVDLLRDPRLREQLVAAAAERIEDLTIEAVTPQFVSLYRDLLAARS